MSDLREKDLMWAVERITELEVGHSKINKRLLAWADAVDGACVYCDGRGWFAETRPEHDSRCNGSCEVGCPVPVQTQTQCPGKCHAIASEMREAGK